MSLDAGTMASIETDSPPSPEEPVECFRTGMAGARRWTMDNVFTCHAEMYPMKWLLGAARSRAALGSGLARLKGRGI